MEKEKKELIDHIKDVLDNHEEPYQLGAWESFQKHRRKHRPMLVWKIGFGIAASLSIVAMISWLVINSSNNGSRRSASNLVKEMNKESFASIPDNVELPGDEKMAIEGLMAISDSEFSEAVGETVKPVNYVELGATMADEQELLTKLEFIKPLALESYNFGNTRANNLFPRSYPSIKLDKTAREGISDIRFGLAISPAVTSGDIDSHLGIGGGISTDWGFSSKFSLASGIIIAQNQLLYEGGESRVASLAGLNGVRVNTVSVEIPVNLQFHFNENVFVSGGIISTTFVKEHYSYNYEYDKLVAVSTLAENNTTVTSFRMVKVQETEEIKEPSFSSFNLAAFYNFSVGYQQSFMEKYKLSFEPFIKIPAMQVTSSDLQYSSAGIQLKVKF